MKRGKGPLGVALAQILREFRLKQKDLAEIMDVNPGTVSKMVNGTGGLTIAMVAKLAEATKMPHSYWFDLEVRRLAGSGGLKLDEIRGRSTRRLPLMRQTELIPAFRGP
jgi:transcriptional regulator with XRE-family HTH domain